jgi:hypothetical protein
MKQSESGMIHTKPILETQSAVRYLVIMASRTRTRVAPPSRSPRSRSPRSRSQWSTLAATAKPKLEGLRFGEREAGLRRLADAEGINPQSLRRALAALRFVETLEEDRFLKKLSLRAVPMAAVEHLARWHGYDKSAALRAARLLANGEYTIASLGAAEAAARSAARTQGIGRSLVHRCRLRVGPVLQAQFKGHEIDARVARDPDAPSVDFRFRPIGSQRWTVAAIIIGPYLDRSRREIRLGDWIVKALGLGAIYRQVILVVPNATIKKDCQAWMRANAVPNVPFSIQIITPEP